MSIKEAHARGLLTVGTVIKTNAPSVEGREAETLVGEIYCNENANTYIYVKHRDVSCNGLTCRDHVHSYSGFSWALGKNDGKSWVEFLPGGVIKVANVGKAFSHVQPSSQFSARKPVIETIMESVIGQFKRLTRSEPEKSFIDLELTDEQGTLTQQGRMDFIQYMFDKEDFRRDFYETVIKPVVAENAKSSKK